MHRTGIVMIGLMLAACDNDRSTPTGPSISGPIVFRAELLASNEVPTVSGPEAGARGTATITFDVPRDTLGNITGAGPATIAMQLSGFPRGTPAIAAHIHTGPAGVPGPVLVGTTLAPTAPVLMGDGTANISVTVNSVPQAQAAAITANPANYYFTVHTPLNPAGAVRGQLTRVR
jgi:hypothetical protein